MRRLLARTAVPSLAAAALAGCVVGPNYAGPPPVAPSAVAASAFRRAAADTTPAPPAARWWIALHDVELDRLEAAALQASPDVAVATARLRQSRADLRLNRANARPNTGASALYLRTKGATDLFGGGAAAAVAAGAGTEGPAVAIADDDTLQFYNVGFDATWELDLFGGHARAVEGARAVAEAAKANLQDAEVSLTAEVAQTYLELRRVQQQIALSERAADVQARLLTLTQARRRGGTASDLDVERLNDELLTTRNQLTPLQAQLAEQFDRLAVLVGREPGTLDAELAAFAAPPPPPAQTPVGDPASLLRRRPDVRAAERRIAQQNALIGQRIADLFPKITLLGDLGFGSTGISSLLQSGSFTYALAPTLQWSPFTFGRTRARIEEAKGARDEALADYRRTVLNALQDAETALARYGRQRGDVAERLRIQASAERAARLTDLRARGGTATSLDVLEAQRQSLNAQANVIQAQVHLTQDYVALQKSLGLGWAAG